MDIQMVPIPKDRRFNNLAGRTDFGRWEVLGFAGDRYWWCRCSCADRTVKKVFGGSLLGDLSRSCGCLKEEPDLARRHLTPKQDHQVRMAYESGTSLTQLAKIWKISQHAIRDAILRAGGTLRTHKEAAALRSWPLMRDPDMCAAVGLKRRLTTFEQDLEMCIRYENGESSGMIAKDYDLTLGSVLKIIKRMGRQTRKYTNPMPFNVAAFDNATEDGQASYYCGLLMADGCVFQLGSTKYVSLSLAEEDGVMIEKYKEWMGAGHKIYVAAPSEHFPNSQPMWHLSIGSTPLADALAKYGVAPHKSLTAKAQGGMEMNPWFWRGMIDGDGWVKIRQRTENKSKYRPVIGLCGSRDSVEQFREFALTITPTKATARPAVNIWAINITGQHAVELAAVLYANAAVAMPRKQQTAMEILARF